MPESKLKETMKSTLLNDSKKDSNVSEVKPEATMSKVDDEFSQATKNISDKDKISSTLESVKPGEPKEVAAEKPDLIVDDKPEKAKTVASRKIEKAAKEPIKSPAVKQAPKRSYVAGSALAISVLAVLVAGYSIVEQKTSAAVLTGNLDAVSTDMGELSLKSDELKVDIIKVQDRVQLNENKIAQFETIQAYIADLDKQIESKLEEIEIVKGRMDRTDKALEKHGKELKALGVKMDKYSARKAPVRKVTKRVAVKKSIEDPTKLGDAVVASIDTWGTQSSVMLRNDRGNWIPMGMGDYYKGWKLSGVMGSEAVFKKGKKIRRLAIEG